MFANILDRNFKADRPNQKWVTDISYIHTKQGVLYLSCIRTGVNKIGEIINLSQVLNSQMWHLLNNGAAFDRPEVQGLYDDVTMLSCMSGLEIDKAKREYALDNSTEQKIIRARNLRYQKQKDQRTGRVAELPCQPSFLRT